MSDPNTKVVPTQFDAVGPTESAQEKSTASDTSRAGGEIRPSGPPRWVMPALAGLVITALLVFFWLPSRVESPRVELEVDAGTAKRRPTLNEVSPWQEAQEGKLRKQAQDILARLLDIQFELEEMNVKQWAGEAFAEASELAQLGDEIYRQQQFVEAGEAYQAALDKLEGISASRSEIFQQHLERGTQALYGYDQETAVAALETALLIEPGHVQAEQLLARASNLDALKALMQQAGDARAAKDLPQAELLLLEAATLDPDDEQVKAELTETRRALTRNRFNDAMTRGYQALDEGRYDQAESAFQQARKLMPASTETESALQEARAARTRARIDTLRKAAEQAANSEQWQQALESYGKILAIDSSVIFARVGAIQARERASIDSKLRKYIHEPERLGDAAIYASARRDYQEASKLENQGPVLQEQLRQLGQVLRVSQTPVAVVLQSDERTDVTVYKVAKLGTFNQHTLELKPGTYTAVGVRSGYRDVRREFKVSHSRDMPAISIVCTEPI